MTMLREFEFKIFFVFYFILNVLRCTKHNKVNIKQDKMKNIACLFISRV